MTRRLRSRLRRRDARWRCAAARDRARGAAVEDEARPPTGEGRRRQAPTTPTARPRGDAAAGPAEGAATRRRTRSTAARARGDRAPRELPARQPATRKEQAEALYKLAELYWEESKAVYLDKMGTLPGRGDGLPRPTARAARTCRASRPPSIWRRRRRSTCASSTTTRSSARSTPSSTSTRSRCATRARSASRSSTSRSSSTSTRAPATSPTPGWRSPSTASTSSRTTRARSKRYEKVLKHPKSQLYDLALFKTAWCYWKLGDTEQVGAALQGRPRPRQEEGGKTEAASRSAPRSCRGRRSTTWSSSSPRTTRRARTTRSSSWPRSAASSTRARC